jgi:tetratricopeptide (TPR) repeat protein
MKLSVSRRGRVWRRAGLLLLAALLAGCQPASPLEEVRSLQEAGDFEASLEPLRRALEADPDDPELHYRNGLALVQTARPAQAAWSLHKAMEHPDWLAPAGLLLASAGLRAGNHELAEQATDRILEAEPDQPAALLLRASARIASRIDYEGALSDSDRVLEADPDSFEALTNRAVALLGLQRIDEAAVAIEELERRAKADASPNAEASARMCTTRAIFAKEKGEREAAGERFAACLEAFPTDGVVVGAALDFYDETRDAERAIEVLRAVLEAQPLAFGSRIALAGRLRAAGRPEEAERLLLEGTELNAPPPEAAWVELARHYQALGQHASMTSALERAVQVAADPAPDLQFFLADALILTERYDEALALARTLPVPAHRSFAEGRVHLEQGRPAQALEHLSEGLRLWPDNAGARYYAARAAERLGDFDRAIEEYRYSIRSDADATDARLRLALLHEAEGKPQLAFEAATSGSRSASPEALLVALRAASRGGLDEGARRTVALLRRWPAMQTQVPVAVAEGTRQRGEPAAAATRLLDWPGLDLRDPNNTRALRELVVCAGAAGKPELAAEHVEAALAASPETADFHEIRGLLLEQRGATPAQIRAGYARALELQPGHVHALLGLARIEAAAGDAEAALALQTRAVEAEPDAAEPLRARAELLLALGRSEEAAAALERLLEETPWDGKAAAQLARVRRDRGDLSSRTLQLERQAERFGPA